MKIKVKRQDEKVLLEVDGKLMEFTFDSIDSLIDSFVSTSKEDFILEAEVEDDEALNNYKALIQNIYDETQNTDFKNAYTVLSKKDITNEEIVKIIGDDQGK